MPAELRIVPRGPFALRAAAAFLAGWPPAGREDADDDGVLRLALGPDGATGTVGAALREHGGAVAAVVTGDGAAADPAAARDRVARALSLDIDGRGYGAVGRRDPVVGAAMRRHPGLRPPLFPSPYEAGVWAILTQRTQLAQSLATRARIVAALGGEVEVAGRRLRTFPAPERLAGLAPGRGLTPERTERLRELARAAVDGRLDAGHLRALPADEALRELRELPGVGPYSAEVILIRGAGAPDVPPLAEPRVRAAVAEAYGLPAPPDDRRLREIAEPWRPFRSWVALLLRADAPARP
ncbi:DNA-3-methyladenine glycosylase family protein [Miltoncostaea marina]|uniref:DNA-3-methyladenine glycosylase family protein n=1 Tax=Miltoncostaea marina TaxID=2843215 RepID=UPI001C3D5D0E|nr:hypothetical protein [Miltoncostaea marina]